VTIRSILHSPFSILHSALIMTDRSVGVKERQSRGLCQERGTQEKGKNWFNRCIRHRCALPAPCLSLFSLLSIYGYIFVLN